MKDYKLTAAAAGDVESIYSAGVEQFGIEQADKYHDALFEAFDFLARYPKAARMRDELPKRIRVHRYRSHMIIHRAEEDGSVLIVRVRHGREDWQADLGSEPGI